MSEEHCRSCGHLRTVHPGPDAHGCDANMCACPGYVPPASRPSPARAQRGALWHAIYEVEVVPERERAELRDELANAADECYLEEEDDEKGRDDE